MGNRPRNRLKRTIIADNRFAEEQAKIMAKEHISPYEKTAMTGKRYCWGCGKKLDKNEEYCGKCGSFNW